MEFFKNKTVIIISIVLVVLAIAGFLYKRETNYVDQIEAMQQTQAEAIKKINEIRAEEQVKQEETIKSYEKALVDISNKYQSAVRNLEAEKKRRKEEILIDRDPKVLAQKLADSMKFKVEVQ